MANLCQTMVPRCAPQLVQMSRSQRVTAPCFSTNTKIQASRRRCSVIVKAEGPSTDAEDAAFEARIKAMKIAKGDTPYGESRRESAKATSSSSSSGAVAEQNEAFWEGETLWQELAPHKGDLAINLALGATLIWLPLTAAAVGRGLFVKYRFTDRRFSVITTAPWKDERLDAAYSEVKDIVTVGRGVGLWGDMVVTMKNGDKIEFRSLPDFLEVKKYIFQQRDAANAAPAKKTSPKGFA